jgi:Fe-S-cluster containining protein
VDLTLRLPPDIHYACRQDGGCCRDVFEVRVQAADVEKILGVDWRGCARLPANAEAPFRPLKKSPGESLLEWVGGACPFLTESNRCRLHERHGFDIKPMPCRAFPYRFTRAGGEVYVGVSFACPSVRKNVGPPVAAQEEAIRALYEAGAPARIVPEPVRFDAVTPIAWDDYLVLERGLDEILGREDRPVERCLVAGHVWLGMLARLLSAAGARSDPSGESVPKVLALYVDRSRDENYGRVFELAQRPAANPVLKRMLLGAFVSFRDALRDRPGRLFQGRLAFIARTVFENARHWARVGSVRLPPLKERVRYRDFHPGAAALRGGEADGGSDFQVCLRRYFRHALFRKDAICHSDLLWGYGYMVMAYGLVQWYAAALEAAGAPDPPRALALVEQYYMHHSSFDQTFLYHPAMANLIQRLFRKPNFAHTIVGG